ncbi:hypothetical protein ACGK9R_07800 [Halomonas sp. HNIBRBA4712]|uniref:hypothetical protein n=1 Tax=Halomonas sp. HNIBRBA4712 TaxID=3373087 RepID=UPI003744EDB9
MVQILYSHHTDTREFVHRRLSTDRYDKACEIIDQYPWAQEMALFDEQGEDGGFEFLLGERNGRHAHYQFIPIEERKGLLQLSVLARTGLFKVLGRRALTRDFHLVCADTAKGHLQDLFEHSIDFLYEKHRPFKR